MMSKNDMGGLGKNRYGSLKMPYLTVNYTFLQFYEIGTYMTESVVHVIGFGSLPSISKDFISHLL